MNSTELKKLKRAISGVNKYAKHSGVMYRFNIYDDTIILEKLHPKYGFAREYDYVEALLLYLKHLEEFVRNDNRGYNRNRSRKKKKKTKSRPSKSAQRFHQR